jgi:hypothetical protein
MTQNSVDKISTYSKLFSISRFEFASIKDITLYLLMNRALSYNLSEISNVTKQRNQALNPYSD